jgi:hypothetical protein
VTAEDTDVCYWIYDVTFDDEGMEALTVDRIPRSRIPLRYRDTQGALFYSDPV